MAGAVTAASLAESVEDEAGADPAEERRAVREERAASRREAKQARAEAKQARRREKSEARAVARARRERHSIEARVEREKAAFTEPEEIAPGLVEDDVVLEEPTIVEVSADSDTEITPAVAEEVEPDDAVDEDVVEPEPEPEPEPEAVTEEPEDTTAVPESEPGPAEAADEPEGPVIDQDTAVALAVASARPEAVSRVVDPVDVAASALAEDKDAEPEPSRSRDAVSASLSDRAAAQLAKRRRREEERAAREAEKAEKAKADTAIVPVVEDHDDRFRPSTAGSDVPEPRAPRPEARSGGTIVATVVSIIGIVGYVCAVLLAVGAMTVALGLESGDAIFDLVSPLCDALVSPARGLVSFSGENAETKELFLAYSVGSVVYLVIGLVAQNLPKRQD